MFASFGIVQFSKFEIFLEISGFCWFGLNKAHICLILIDSIKNKNISISFLALIWVILNHKQLFLFTNNKIHFQLTQFHLSSVFLGLLTCVNSVWFGSVYSLTKKYGIDSVRFGLFASV